MRKRQSLLKAVVSVEEAPRVIVFCDEIEKAFEGTGTDSSGTGSGSGTGS